MKLENLEGVQRWFSRNKSDAKGEIEVPGYVGERYIVRAFDFVSAPEFRGIVHFEGSAALDVSDQKPSILVALQQIKK